MSQTAHPTPVMQQIITEIATKHGVQLDRVGAYLRLDQPGYDRLSIEVIGPHQVSVAHYFEQHGDLIHDPEIVFWTGGETWTPIAIGQVLGNWREVAWIATDGSRLRAIQPAGQANVARFATTWAANLRRQGWLDIAQPTRVIRGNARDESTAALEQAA